MLSCFFSFVDDQEPNPETLLSQSAVSEFYTETAKLKSLEILHKVWCFWLLLILILNVITIVLVLIFVN